MSATGDPKGVRINDLGKLIVQVWISGMATFLLNAGKIDTAIWALMVGSVGGFVVGNGVNALKRLPGSPVLTSRGAEPALVQTTADGQTTVTMLGQPTRPVSVVPYTSTSESSADREAARRIWATAIVAYLRDTYSFPESEGWALLDAYRSGGLVGEHLADALDRFGTEP